MQTHHRLRRFRDLRAVSPGARPPADGVPVRCGASEWKGALPLPDLSKPSLARLGSRPAVPAVLLGTGPESGAVPRGRQHKRVIRFRRSRGRDSLPDRACRALFFRQATVHPGDGRAHAWQHDRPPVGVAACLPVCALAYPPGWPSGRMPICMPACLPAWRAACLCPSPVR